MPCCCRAKFPALCPPCLLGLFFFVHMQRGSNYWLVVRVVRCGRRYCGGRSSPGLCHLAFYQLALGIGAALWALSQQWHVA